MINQFVKTFTTISVQKVAHLEEEEEEEEEEENHIHKEKIRENYKDC
jgi:hypothetical protein